MITSKLEENETEIDVVLIKKNNVGFTKCEGCPKSFMNGLC